MTATTATVRAVDAGKIREEHPCGCAYLYEPPTAEGGRWSKCPVRRCPAHRWVQTEQVAKPPEVTK